MVVLAAVMSRQAFATKPSRMAVVGGRIPPPRDSFPPWAFEPRHFFRQEIIHTSTKSGARVTRIHTPHGIIDTPSFVAVATNGACKSIQY